MRNACHHRGGDLRPVRAIARRDWLFPLRLAALLLMSGCGVRAAQTSSRSPVLRVAFMRDGALYLRSPGHLTQIGNTQCGMADIGYVERTCILSPVAWSADGSRLAVPGGPDFAALSVYNSAGRRLESIKASGLYFGAFWIGGRHPELYYEDQTTGVPAGNNAVAVDGMQFSGHPFRIWPHVGARPFRVFNTLAGCYSVMAAGEGGGRLAFYERLLHYAAPFELVHWYPARHLLLLSVLCGSWLRIDTATGRRSQLPFDGRYAIAVSPSGAIAGVLGPSKSQYGSAGETAVMTSRAGSVRVVPGARFPAWSPDGRWLYYSPQRSSLLSASGYEVSAATAVA